MGASVSKIAFASALLALTTAESNAGTKFKVLAGFDGSDGSNPAASVINGKKGSYIGTTTYAGPNGQGVVFKLAKNGALTDLYAFSSSGDDGWYPVAPVIGDAQGNLYGTTTQGPPSGCSRNANGCGTVFELTKKGALNLRYVFTGESDGFTPTTGLVEDKQGNFYGTVSSGGTGGYGNVYKLSPDGTYTVLQAFDAGSDGGYPEGDLIMDQSGNLYGTSETGGNANQYGTIYEVSATGAFSVLYTFTGGGDGGNPVAGLIEDADGNCTGPRPQAAPATAPFSS